MQCYTEILKGKKMKAFFKKKESIKPPELHSSTLCVSKAEQLPISEETSLPFAFPLSSLSSNPHPLSNTPPPASHLR
jgi:hypothetical protein